MTALHSCAFSQIHLARCRNACLDNWGEWRNIEMVCVVFGGFSSAAAPWSEITVRRT